MNKFTNKRKILPRSVWTNPIHFIACGFGIGALPWMPGTFGTLAAIPIYLILQKFPIAIYLTVVILMIGVGIIICDITNRDFGTEDHPAAVWDEMATFPIVLIGLPVNWFYIFLGVILFRFFDICKPGPIGWVDRNIHGGIGVMLDDLMAALFSLAILQTIIWVYNFM